MRPDQKTITTLVGLGTLGGVEALQGFGVSMYTPEIAGALKVAVLSVVSARALGFVLGAVLPLAVPSLLGGRRIAVQLWACRIGAMVCALSLALTGEVKSTGALVAVLALTAVGSTPGRALQPELAYTEVDETFRGSALSVVPLIVAFAQFGLALGVAVGLMSSWTKSLESQGLLAVLAVLLWGFLTRPTGKHDEAAAQGGSDVEPLPWGELTAAWRRVPSLVGVAVGLLAIGALSTPLLAFLSIYLHQRWHLGLQGTATVFMVVAGVSTLMLLVNSTRADKQLPDRPERSGIDAWRAMLSGAVLLGVGVLVPNRTVLVIAVALGAALVVTALPLLLALAVIVVPPPQRRPLLSAAAGVYAAGGLLGVIYGVPFAGRHGARSALVALAVLGVLAAVLVRQQLRSVLVDRESATVAAADQRNRIAMRASGKQPPLLECRGIDFSYGQLQVLFEVDFALAEGEMVALLGTNGAGKSTLLKTISGIGLPDRGSVWLGGREITYLSAEERVHLGITQIPGGRAVFGSLNVVENLQSYGYTLGRDRKAVDEAVERCLDAFPRLRERRTSLAATLSGGEQQMVALSKALILRPKVLLIDELSLGLAPVVIGPLLDMVRRINEEGTAVVIVEQSVNVALSMVKHAYFMEKGTVRFDGKASDLLERSDLLRAVFLQGAAKGAVA